MKKEQLLKNYKSMFLLRRMEEELVKYYYDNKVMSFVHFYVGQEAVAVGVCSELSLEDCAFGNHRSHGHYLAKGGDPRKMVSELLGKKNGCCAGKGGSMHMIDRTVNFKGSTPILGSVAPISAGHALGQNLKGEEAITVGFIGDGASEEGVVYESMNIAALFKLPWILVIENNHYSVNTKTSERRSPDHSMQTIAQGFGCVYIEANGNDFFDVNQKMQTAIEVIKTQQKPVVLECKVYRHMAHSAPICDDKVGYRKPDDNPENRQKNDSVKNMRQQMLDLYDFDENMLRFVENEVEVIVKDAIEFAVADEYPHKDEMNKDVYHV
jgi:pyruvate dehydrogenase E1 component alpha subunit